MASIAHTIVVVALSVQSPLADQNSKKKCYVMLCYVILFGSVIRLIHAISHIYILLDRAPVGRTSMRTLPSNRAPFRDCVPLIVKGLIVCVGLYTLNYSYAWIIESASSNCTVHFYIL